MNTNFMHIFYAPFSIFYTQFLFLFQKVDSKIDTTLSLTQVLIILKGLNNIDY